MLLSLRGCGVIAVGREQPGSGDRGQMQRV